MEEVADGFFNYAEYNALQAHMQSGAAWYGEDASTYVTAFERGVSPPPLDRVILPPSPLKPMQPPAQSVPMAFVHARDLAKTMPPPPVRPRTQKLEQPAKTVVLKNAIHRITGPCVIFANKVEYPALRKLPTNEELTRRYESNIKLHMGMTGATVSDHPM